MISRALVFLCIGGIFICSPVDGFADWRGVLTFGSQVQYTCPQPVVSDFTSCRSEASSEISSPVVFNLDVKVQSTTASFERGNSGFFPASFECPVKAAPFESSGAFFGVNYRTFGRCKVHYTSDSVEIAVAGELYFGNGAISKIELYAYFHTSVQNCSVLMSIQTATETTYYLREPQCSVSNVTPVGGEPFAIRETQPMPPVLP